MATYLYNGVELPPFPESEHRYIYVTKESSGFSGGIKHDAILTPEPYYGYYSSVEYCIGGRAGCYWYFCDTKYSNGEVPTPLEWVGTDNAFENDIVWCVPEEVLWANFDILDENGNVILPASYPTDPETGEEITIYGLNGHREVPPIPSMPAAIMLGFQTGTATRLMRKKREPIAYLYGPNQVRLPEIPAEVTAYPYVVLQYLIDGGDTILAYGYETEPYVESYKPPLFGDSYDRLRIDSGETRAGNWYNTEPYEWYVVDPENVTDAALGYHTCKLSNIIWANFDIYASDGTPYMLKTDPVPVYK